MNDSTRPSRHARTRRSRWPGAAALACAVLVAGCGGGSQHPAVARLRSTTTSTSTARTSRSRTSRSSTTTGRDAASSGAGAGSPDSAALAFSRCMRAHGVSDFPDPAPGGGFLFPRGSVNLNSPIVQAARSTCQKLMPGGGPPGPGTQTHPTAQALTQMVAIARCMRRHGVANFPDPRTSVPSSMVGVQVLSDIDGVILVFPAGIDQQSAVFTRAAATCRFPLHNH
jgi:hypothetical protein